jgi:hypothetical protein
VAFILNAEADGGFRVEGVGIVAVEAGLQRGDSGSSLLTLPPSEWTVKSST